MKNLTLYLLLVLIVSCRTTDEELCGVNIDDIRVRVLDTQSKLVELDSTISILSDGTVISNDFIPTSTTGYSVITRQQKDFILPEGDTITFVGFAANSDSVVQAKFFVRNTECGFQKLFGPNEISIDNQDLTPDETACTTIFVSHGVYVFIKETDQPFVADSVTSRLTSSNSLVDLSNLHNPEGGYYATISDEYSDLISDEGEHLSLVLHKSNFEDIDLNFDIGFDECHVTMQNSNDTIYVEN